MLRCRVLLRLTEDQELFWGVGGGGVNLPAEATGCILGSSGTVPERVKTIHYVGQNNKFDLKRDADELNLSLRGTQLTQPIRSLVSDTGHHGSEHHV